MNQDQLLSFLWDLAGGQRWFPGRAGTPLGLKLGDCVGVDDAQLRPALLEVGFPDGHSDEYLIPLLLRDGKEPVDACDEGGILLEALHRRLPGFEALREVPSGLPARRFSGEQSNTTVFFGQALLAKVFRRIERGVNLDVEVHEVLAGTGLAAELYGRWRVNGADYAVFLEALHQPTDGYVLACRYAKEGRDFSSHAWALGDTLNRMHAVLAARLPTGTISGAQLAAACRQRFTAVVAEVEQVAPFAAAASSVFETVAAAILPAQRIHGDCHLGQAMLTQDRWVYVDFEGEPLKPLAERRLPDSPLRDVAGMLRSFGYARAEGEADEDWLLACRRAFLEGYGLDPNTPGVALAAYETDKAGYEVTYEARYRPNLMPVPLDFLASLSKEKH